MSRAKQSIVGQVRELVASLSVLHQASPFRDEPIDLVEWVRSDAFPLGAQTAGNASRGYVPVVQRRGEGS